MKDLNGYELLKKIKETEELVIRRDMSEMTVPELIDFTIKIRAGLREIDLRDPEKAGLFNEVRNMTSRGFVGFLSSILLTINQFFTLLKRISK